GDEWWEAYVKLYQRVHNDAEYPVGVQTYLTSLWAQRLVRQMPMLEGSLLREQGQGGTVAIKLLADAAYRAQVLRNLMLGRMDDAGEMVPLPPHGVRVTGLTAPQAEVEVETIATHVPEECFYIRFGTFTNYLWFRDFMARWKGDLGNMLFLRSIRRSTSDLVSKQIALKETELARILGPQVISDVAIVGTDPYVGDGAAIGLIFQAKNNFLLAADFNKKRAAAQKEHDDATIETVEIAGHKVSYLSTPDGTL